MDTFRCETVLSKFFFFTPSDKDMLPIDAIVLSLFVLHLSFFGALGRLCVAFPRYRHIYFWNSLNKESLHQGFLHHWESLGKESLDLGFLCHWDSLGNKSLDLGIFCHWDSLGQESLDLDFLCHWDSLGKESIDLGFPCPGCPKGSILYVMAPEQ